MVPGAQPVNGLLSKCALKCLGIAYKAIKDPITGPKKVGGGRRQMRFSQKPKFVVFFLLKPSLRHI